MSDQPTRAGLAWTTIEDDMLRDQFNEDLDLEAIVLNHQRTVAAIVTRMICLGLLVDIGGDYHRVHQDRYSSYKETKALQKKLYG